MKRCRDTCMTMSHLSQMKHWDSWSWMYHEYQPFICDTRDMVIQVSWHLFISDTSYMYLDETSYMYRVAKNHRMSYLYWSFSAKEPYNQWLFGEKWSATCNQLQVRRWIRPHQVKSHIYKPSRFEPLYQPYFGFWLFAWSRCGRIAAQPNFSEKRWKQN